MKYIRPDFVDKIERDNKHQRKVWYKSIYEERGCYVCDNLTNQDGYLRVGWVADEPESRRTVMAHVLVWESLNGPIPEAKEVNHKCRNRKCFNPEHLELLDGSEHATYTNVSRVGYTMERRSDEKIADFYYQIKYKGVPINEIVRQDGIKRSTMSSIMNKRSRTELTDAVDEYVRAWKLFS